MKPVSQRHKLIGGVFVIVGVAWSVDMLTGGPVPQDAAAADNPELLPGKVELPPVPEDLDQIIQALRVEQSTRQTLPFESAARDLFTPANWFMEQVHTDSGQTSPDNDHESVPGEESLTFDKKHHLQGVLSGSVPLALIDGQLIRVGARVDEYTLVEIKDDYVTFESDCDRAILRVRQAGSH